jgi:hypothetical protein
MMPGVTPTWQHLFSPSSHLWSMVGSPDDVPPTRAEKIAPIHNSAV